MVENGDTLRESTPPPLLSNFALLIGAAIVLAVGIGSALAGTRASPHLAADILFATLLVGAAASARFRFGSRSTWGIAVAGGTALYLVTTAFYSGGPAHPEFIWLLAAPLIYLVVTPDNATAVAACATVCSAGVITLMLVFDAPAVDTAVRIAESVGLGALSIYAATRQRRAREQSEAVAAAREATLAQLEISERKRVDAERMASIGRLAAGVGHEINNPLTYVVHNLDYARESLAFDKTMDRNLLAESIDQAREGAKRIKRIVGELRKMARPKTAEIIPVDVRDVLEGSLRLVHNQIKHSARLVTEVGGSGAVMADPDRLGQVFVNLLANAAQAIPPGSPHEHEIGVRVQDHGLQEVRIEVWDTGTGIEGDDIDKVFEPSFTTKRTSHGTGLGLAISRNIVNEMGGRISVASVPGEGTRFTIVLPQAHEQTQNLEVSRPTLTEATRGRILLIDDEASVLKALGRALERQHAVTTTTRAVEALQLIERGRVFDLIICDLMMPEMDGSRFYGEIKLRFPELVNRIVFMSGGTFETGIEAFLETVPNPRIEKPCDLKTLRNIVARELLRSAA